MAARVRVCNYVNLKLVRIIESLLKIVAYTAHRHKPLLLSLIEAHNQVKIIELLLKIEHPAHAYMLLL